MLCPDEPGPFPPRREGFSHDMRRPSARVALILIALAAVSLPLLTYAQETPNGVLRIGPMLERPNDGQRHYLIAGEQRDVLPVVNVDLTNVDIPIRPDGSVVLKELLGPLNLPPEAGLVTLRVQAGDRTVMARVQLGDLNNGSELSLPLYADKTPANQLDNPAFDRYSEAFAPIGWSFDLLSGHGAFIGGTAAEPDGRKFTMELKPRPDGVDSSLWQVIPATTVPADGTQAVATIEALASMPKALFLEILVIANDREQLLASVAHPGTGQWATLAAKADLPAGLAAPMIKFRMRRAASATGRTAFDNASLIIPKVYRRYANVTIASNADKQYRTQSLIVPPGGQLEFGTGVASPFKMSSARAVRFRVTVDADDEQKNVFDQTMALQDGVTPSAWRDQRADLSAWSGRTVQLVFESEYAGDPPSDNPEPDTAMPLWGDVVVEAAVQEGASRPPNLIVISLDTLRADHLGLYGYKRATSPGLDRFAQQAYVFEQCFSACSWTTPAHATAFTGLLPSVHGAGIRRGEFAQRGRLPDSATTFAERAQAAGYRTAAFTEGYFCGSRWGLGQGFDRYHDGPTDPTPHSGAVEATFGRATEWLRDAGPQPFLLFVHTYATHWPYSPPEPYRSQFLTDPNAKLPEPDVALDGKLDAAGFQTMKDYYDGGIAHMDHVVGELFAELSARGVLDNTWVIIFSDHGEEFGEHGRTMHGFSVYDEVLHVPLIIRPPRGLSQTQRIPNVVGLTDLFGTVLGILGDTKHTPPTSSVSLMPYMAAGPPPVSPRDAVIGELIQHQEHKYFVSSRDADHKYIATTSYGDADAAIPGSLDDTEAGFDINYPIAVIEHAKQATPSRVAEELYNVRETPNESKNLAAKDPALLGAQRDTLLRQLLHIRDTAAANAAAPDLAAPLSAEEIERLKAIGYVEDTPAPKP